MKLTPVKEEFKKVSDPFLTEKDFDNGPLPFLIQTHSGEKPNHSGVEIISQIGDIFTARASYDGLKDLDNDADVKRIEYSRPGGMM